MGKNNYSISLEGKKLYIREFLNAPGYHSSAHVIAEISCENEDNNGRDGWDSVDANLELMDCSRKVTLDFNAHRYGSKDIKGLQENIKEAENTLAKLEKLKEVVDDFARIGKKELKGFIRRAEKAKKLAIKKKENEDVKTSGT